MCKHKTGFFIFVIIVNAISSSIAVLPKICLTVCRISYCADDKAEKRFFSFIAKEADSEKHTCFVFVSDKLVSKNT